MDAHPDFSGEPALMLLFLKTQASDVEDETIHGRNKVSSFVSEEECTLSHKSRKWYTALLNLF